MYVCVCNAVTEHTIRQAAADGVRSLEELQMHTGCATGCGCCALMAEEVLRQAIGQSATQIPREQTSPPRATLVFSR